eukprot:CAMPEP_0168623148 /NCGR_PEP_ID=MMETSP0449_2-20121227/8666_1 /TAXON_ID=1082188 /ORGANISM="Strombidium rassoulzadegani, Strain ras09" /LENGTH=105 /DNA_ID=CAMNT_0008664501 /DNA_START=213 /DNA_END=526 /DNA_ORIENTATION=+
MIIGLSLDLSLSDLLVLLQEGGRLLGGRHVDGSVIAGGALARGLREGGLDVARAEHLDQRILLIILHLSVGGAIGDSPVESGDALLLGDGLEVDGVDGAEEGGGG